MGRIVAFILACLAAIGGWFLANEFHDSSVWLIGNVERFMLAIEFRQLYAVIAGLGTWLIALHFLWPRTR